ncbi:hypothetical protein SSYM_1221, partial [Serratia symbiotica str. Tucson]
PNSIHKSAPTYFLLIY